VCESVYVLNVGSLREIVFNFRDGKKSFSDFGARKIPSEFRTEISEHKEGIEMEPKQDAITALLSLSRLQIWTGVPIMRPNGTTLGTRPL